MIQSIIIISIAFAWLLIETDWLRIRLTVGVTYSNGDYCDWRLPDSAVTQDMRFNLISSWKLTKIQLALFAEGNLNPLCGWGYAYQYRDFKPEYKVELIDEHSHYTMRTDNTQVLRDAFRVYRNPYLKVRL